MDVATETLCSNESISLMTSKLGRLVVKFREVSLNKPDAHITMLGYMSSGSVADEGIEETSSRMVRWAIDMRDKLITLGVPSNLIAGYIPRQPVPTTDDLVVLTLRDAAEPVNLFPGMRVISPADAASRQSPDSSSKGTPEKESPIKGQVVIDPFAKPGPVRPGRNVDTQIEVTLWDSNSAGIGRKLPPMKVTLNVSQNSIEEVGGELTVFKQKLKSQMLWGAISKVELSVKLSGKLDFDQSTAQHLIGQWSAQLKSSLEFDLKIPKTSIGVHVEGSLGVDQAGKVVPGLQFTWDF
jgi:hypothetical protein